MTDRKLFAPSADRNRHAILPALAEVLPSTGTVLEIASGTGQHAVHFAEHLPALTWQPTEIDEANLKSIECWRQDAHLPNLLPPLWLDVASDAWPTLEANALVCSNMVHIAPWNCTLGLLSGAGRLLPVGGPLALYGAYFIDGRPTAPSNLEFDAYLRSQNSAWGVRNLRDVVHAAAQRSLNLDRVIDMPGNNFLVVYRKTTQTANDPGP